MNNMRSESWCGCEIRFIEIDGEWWAILKDICDALRLRVDNVANRLDPDMLIKVPMTVIRNRPEKYDPCSKGVVKISHTTVPMIAINEIGIYEALFASRRLEARKFRRWSAEVMRKLRTQVGLAGYEVMRMTDEDVQYDIDNILDTLFVDEETGVLMQSVTVQGGDVDQVPFLED